MLQAALEVNDTNLQKKAVAANDRFVISRNIAIGTAAVSIVALTTGLFLWQEEK